MDTVFGSYDDDYSYEDLFKKLKVINDFLDVDLAELTTLYGRVQLILVLFALITMSINSKKKSVWCVISILNFNKIKI